MSPMLAFFLGAVGGAVATFAGCAVAYLHTHGQDGPGTT